MYDPIQELEHFGIKGMKWGVRRTPEQLGHKPKAKSPVEKWKAKQLNKIDKAYNKTYKALDKAAAENPDDKSIGEYVKKLKKQQKSDRSDIEKMTYMDVQGAKKASRAQAQKKAVDTITAAGGAAMWTAKMALMGVRLGGTAVILNVLSDMGRTAMDWIASPEGQETVAAGANIIQTVGNFQLFGIDVFKHGVSNFAPGSALDQTLSGIDIDALKPGANYVPPEIISGGMSAVRRRK